jgi:hypothetical protein
MVLPRAHLSRGARLTGGGVAALLLAVPLSGGVALAAPKNNGTIKVHSVGTPLDDNRNEPKQVCAFYLAAFGFDADQELSYAFATQPGGVAAGTPGTFTVGPTNARPTGDGYSPDLSLPDGQYKVTVTTSDGTKTKVFKVQCADEPDTTPADSTTPADDTTPESGTTPETDTTPSDDTTPPDAEATTDGDPGTVGDPADDAIEAGTENATTVVAMDGVVRGEIIRDTDEGPAPVGSVQTGGGGLAGTTERTDTTIPLTLLAVATGALVVTGGRRRSTH